MGQIQEFKHKKKLLGAFVVIAMTAIVVTLLPHKPTWLGGSFPTPDDKPLIKGVLVYQLETMKEETMEPVSSRHGFASFEGEAPPFDKSYFDEKCPIKFFSDIGFRSDDLPPTTPPAPNEKPVCKELQAVFVTNPTNIGVSIEVRSGRDFVAWIKENPDVRNFLNSEIGQGLFQSLNQALQIRGEDLGIPKFMGPMLMNIAESALSADAKIDWMSDKGERAVVFSMNRTQSETATQVIFGLSKYLGRKIYQLQNLKTPIVELTLGSHRLFVTENDERLYIGFSVFAVVSALENSDAPRAPRDVDGTVAITVHANGFFKGKDSFAAAVKDWKNYFSLNLSATKSEPSQALIQGTKMIDLVQGGLQEEVLRAIPFDAVAAVVLAHKTPKNLSEFSWSNVVEQSDVGKESLPGSSAIVWDFDQGANHLSAVGIATATADPTAAQVLASAWADASLVTTCANERVVLLASLPALLNRMKESCNRQSLSVADWRSELKLSEISQTLVFLNSSIFGKEVFRYGLALSENEWQQRANDNDQNADSNDPSKGQKGAKEEAAELAKRVLPNFDALPMIGYSGAVNDKKVIAMTGFKKASGVRK